MRKERLQAEQSVIFCTKVAMTSERKLGNVFPGFVWRYCSNRCRTMKSVIPISSPSEVNQKISDHALKVKPSVLSGVYRPIRKKIEETEQIS
jgi:hypothetical protein